MSNRELPEELLNQILNCLKPSLGPESGFRNEHALLQGTLFSWMYSSRDFYRLAEPVLYHTITSGDLHRAMENTELTPTRRNRMARLVRVLYADFRESHHIARLPGLPNLPIARLQVSMCTNLQLLVLAISTYPRRVLPAKLLQGRDTLIPGLPNPNARLANLCRFEIRPIEYLRDDLDLDSDGWFLLLAKLPQMKNISVPTITERAFVPPRVQPSTQEQTSSQEQAPHLTSLALTSQPLTPGLLEAILQAFPTLEELIVTWPTKGDIPPIAADIWHQLGQVLREHGLSLRKIHFQCKRTPRGSLINIASLRNLQSLALPIEAVISEPVGPYRATTTTGNASHEQFGPHAPGECVNTFTIPLSYLLPPNLRSLTITDDWNLWADVSRLDSQLRDLMRHPVFCELRLIRLRRKKPFFQFRDLGWFGHSPERFWLVMKRPRSIRQVPRPAYEPRLREV